VRVTFTDAALDDLRRLGPGLVPKALKTIVVLVEDPELGLPLGDRLTGFRKLVVGRDLWRVVYRLPDDGIVEICEIWCAGTRSDSEVYAEATAWVMAAPSGDPALQRLADVISVLGRRVTHVEAVWPPEPQGEPVPDWLAHRLVHKAGVAAEKVAALNLEQAVDLWTQVAGAPRDDAEPAAAEAVDATRLAYEWGRAVREMREQRGWTQAQLAEAAAMTEPDVARVEAGATVPTIPLLERPAQALDADVMVWLSPRTSA